MLKVLLAGQGGQGVLSAGRFLAECGLHEGKEVSYLPAYGPEMRGGTANCSVIVSEKPIASPLCTVPDVLIALNAPSFHKFAPRVAKGGLLANDLAMEAGDIRSANMVMAGALCELTKVVKERSFINCLNEKFIGKAHVCEVNKRAFAAGIAAVKEQKN